MADILIRGIDFPQCCGECPFQASRWTGDFCSAGQFMIGIDFDYRHKHPKCPLVPLAEGHGRLGDLDAVAKEAYRRLLECEKYGTEFQKPYEIIRAIETAKTIVPAEGGGEDG